MYGEKIVTNSVDEKNMVILKGWFPSSCVALHEDERVKYSKEAQQQQQEEEEVNDDVDDKKEKWKLMKLLGNNFIPNLFLVDSFNLIDNNLNKNYKTLFYLPLRNIF